MTNLLSSLIWDYNMEAYRTMMKEDYEYQRIIYERVEVAHQNPLAITILEGEDIFKECVVIKAEARKAMWKIIVKSIREIEKTNQFVYILGYHDCLKYLEATRICERRLDHMNERALEHLDEFFFKTGDELIKELKKNKEYDALSNKAAELRKKFPILEELFDGKNMDRAYHLASDEREAISKYVDIKMEMQDSLNLQYYLRGHRDCFIYLLQCGMIE